MNVSDEHKTVLLQEASSALSIRADGLYIDGTFGRGGHTEVILQCLDENGRIIAIDKDEMAIEYGKRVFKDDKRIEFINSSFTSIGQISKDRNLTNDVNGILLDLGVSSPQLVDPARGFSFKQNGPLDMRMDQKHGITASEWLNTANEQDISEVIWRYGEEKASRKVAAAIVEYRQKKTFTQTLELADLCAKIIKKQRIDKHPATKVFQAIRIYINNELSDLQSGLNFAFDALAAKGRLVVISFHSLEDRIVKQFMQKKSSDCLPSKMPIRESELSIEAKIIGKKIKPTAAEIQANKKSRSAVMRILEKN